MEGAILQKGCIIAPNSVVPPGRIVKERQVWGGNPIKYIRKALEQEAFVSFEYCRHSNDYAETYNSTFLPYNNAYLYRHGPSEVLKILLSPLTRRLVSTITNKNKLSKIMILHKVLLIVTVDSSISSIDHTLYS